MAFWEFMQEHKSDNQNKTGKDIGNGAWQTHMYDISTEIK